MIEPMCKRMHKMGQLVKYLQKDKAGENKKLQMRVKSADWKLNITFEYTAAWTP